MRQLFEMLAIGIALGGLGACAVDPSEPHEDLTSAGSEETPAEANQSLTTLEQWGVGIIPTDFVDDNWGSRCPSGSDLVRIRMDDEDNNNYTHFTEWSSPQTTFSATARYCRSGGGWPWVEPKGTGCNTTIAACRVDGRLFKAMTTSTTNSSQFYAVLKLGQTCPNGSQEFTRRVDNEDHNNNNQSSGDIAPNVSTSNTTLKFCLFRSSTAPMSSFPNFSVPYGVFHDFEGTQPSWVISKRWAHSDDEDNNNTNSVSPESPDFENIIHVGHNTRFEIARVR